MGRKNKGSKKTYLVKERDIALQRQKDLGVLVARLLKSLKLINLFNPSITPAKNWEHYIEIEGILSQIITNETETKEAVTSRQDNIEAFMQWLKDHGAEFDGIEIGEFEGYDLGLKATKDFEEGSLILVMPRALMLSERHARDSELGNFISVDPLLQNMPHVTLALYLLLEKYNPDSFWKPYIDILPEKYSTVFYYTPEELATLKPSPMLEASLKLYRSIARQYAYFYNKIHAWDLPITRTLQEIFTFDNYRWAVSTVMTRQNSISYENSDMTVFIPLWDMCNHAQGKITTDFNKDLDRGECYALSDFKENDQVFIFYGARPNADLFLHNGFVYPNNLYDSMTLSLGVSSADFSRDSKVKLLSKLGLANVTSYNLYRTEPLLSPELLAFIRIFNMNQEELEKWMCMEMPAELVGVEAASIELVGIPLETKAYKYLQTRCKLLLRGYKSDKPAEGVVENTHRKNIRLLKECEVQILEGAVKFLDEVLEKLNPEEKAI